MASSLIYETLCYKSVVLSNDIRKKSMNARQQIDSTDNRPASKLEFPLKKGLKIGAAHPLA